MLRFILVVAAFSFIACASRQFEVSAGARYDWQTETGYGAEIQMKEEGGGLTAGLGASYVERTKWGDERITLQPRVGYWLPVYNGWYLEGGGGAHIVPGWTSGTWAEFLGYGRIGYKNKKYNAWFEINHQVSNAATDTFGEHARRPGIGIAAGITIPFSAFSMK